MKLTSTRKTTHVLVMLSFVMWSAQAAWDERVVRDPSSPLESQTNAYVSSRQSRRRNRTLSPQGTRNSVLSFGSSRRQPSPRAQSSPAPGTQEQDARAKKLARAKRFARLLEKPSDKWRKIKTKQVQCDCKKGWRASKEDNCTKCDEEAPEIDVSLFFSKWVADCERKYVKPSTQEMLALTPKPEKLRRTPCFDADTPYFPPNKLTTGPTTCTVLEVRELLDGNNIMNMYTLYAMVFTEGNPLTG